MTDEKKLNYIKQQFNDYISSIETLAQFKAFLGNITKPKVIIVLKNRIDKDLAIHNRYKNNAETRVAELTEFKNQIEQILE